MLPRGLKVSIPLPGPDRDIRVRLTEGGLAASACVAVATTVALLTDIGESADLSFYATVAQVIPVFLLALVVEVRARLDHSFGYAVAAIQARTDEYERLREVERAARDRDAEDPALQAATAELDRLGRHLSDLRGELADFLPFVQRVVRGYVLAAVPGEAGSLAALAAGRGSTLLLALGVASLLALLLLYMRSVGSRFDLELAR